MLLFLRLEYLLSYCILIKCQYEVGNFEAAKEWIRKGLEIVENKKLNIDSPTNHIFKEAYIEFICLVHLLEKKYDKFENYVLNQLIPSLEATDNYFESGYYFGHLGQIYYNQGRYKESAEIMNKARESYRNINTLFRE